MAQALEKQKLRPRYQGLRVTREEYLDLEEDGFQYDVINGVMQVAPSPNFEHGSVQGKIFARFDRYLEKNPIARLSLETDVFLPDGGDPLRPDISLILSENLHIVKTHIHGTPELVCEVLNAATRERDLGVKAERYLKCGVKEYWIADPDNKTLQVWYNAKDHWEKVAGVMEFHSKLLPDLVVTTKEIFG
ncbi:MAG: Uma2 family endonuclease [Leptospiraceae bacterium]|nr:Uma2 family endonuclease [Leptospiraceae bacterium]